MERTSNGYLVNPDDWTTEVMMDMAMEDDFDLTIDMIEHIGLAREYYAEHASVPPIRVFAKYIGVDKKDLFKLYLGGPMKFITKYGGLPQPTGCV